MKLLESKAVGEPSPKTRSAIAIGSLIAVVAVLAYGMVASCSTDMPDDANEMIITSDDAKGDDAIDLPFYGASNWAFMTDETLSRFERSFYGWLLDGGLPSGSYVYLHSEDIECVDGIWRAYARTPIDDTYYLVRFDAQTKETSYEAVNEPEFARQQQSVREEAQAPSEQEPELETPSDRRDASRNVSLDDANGLRACMPERAAETLPGIICEYAASKGLSTSPALCSVYPESITAEGAVTCFSVLMYDEQKRGYIIEADYDAGSDRFGLSLRSL